MNYSYFFFLGIAVLPAIMCGQATDTVDIPTIEYRASRLYAPLFQEQFQTVDSTELSTYTDQTLSDVLMQESHLILKSYGSSSLSTASFRGKSASHTGVYWNGLRINSPLVGQVDMNAVPISAVDKLTILPGNASLKMGSGSIGGSIALESKLRGICADCSTGNKLRIKGVQKIGSLGERSTIFQYRQAIGNAALGLGAYYRKAENDFEFLNTALRIPRLDTQRNATYDQWGITGGLRFIPERSSENRHNDTINISVWYQDFDRQVPPQMPDLGVERDETQENNSLRSALQYTLQLKDNIHDFNLGFTMENTTYKMYFLVPDQQPYEQYNADSDYKTLQLKYEYKTTFAERHHFNLSTRHAYQWAHYTERRSSTDFNAYRYTGEIQSTYLYRFSEQLHTEVVGNIAFYQGGEFQFNGSAGLFYHTDRILNTRKYQSAYTIGLEIGRNTHQPSLNDLYWEPGGNPDLTTEKSIEISMPMGFWLKSPGRKLDFNLKPYYSDVRDWILWKPSQYRFWSPINLRHVTSAGVEANLDFYFSHGNYTSDFQSTYTFSPTLDMSVGAGWNVKHQLLPYIPLHSAQLSYTGTFLPFNIDFQYAVQFHGGRYVDGAYEGRRTILPSYGLHNAHISYHYKLQNINSKIVFRIENIWDTDYQSIQWRPMPGRHYALLIQLNFNK